MRPPFLRHQRVLRGGAALAIFAVLGTLMLLPEKSPALRVSLCPIRQLTGLPCALCGGTRSARALLHADWHRAASLNILAVPAVVLLALAGLVAAAEALRGRALLDWPSLFRHLRWAAPFSLLLLLGWWLFQMDSALRGGKEELLDLHNPIAARLYDFYHREEGIRTGR